MAPETARELSPKELHGRMEEGSALCLIDTLGGDHFRKVHLPGAVHACVFEVTFLDQVKGITEDKGREVVLYGSSGRSMDATQAARKLAEAGYTNLCVLRGGLEAWRAEGLPLEGEGADELDDPQTLLRMEDRSYRVDTAGSTIEWTGRNPGTTHFGTVRITAGEIQVKGGTLTGSFDIDMTSIRNHNLEGDPLQPVLIAHLQSDDFFLTRVFPTARFEIFNGQWVREPYLSAPNCEISGTLSLCGVQAEQRFMATVTPTPENGLAAEAHFDIDRTRWGIVYGSTRFFEHLGMHLVFDLISLQVRILAM